jgi:anaerobic magnesium-protoporphyrin IX monomethyl ester cyclase
LLASKMLPRADGDPVLRDGSRAGLIARWPTICRCGRTLACAEFICAGDDGRRMIRAMNVLLLSMPDSFEHMPARGVRMPNGALASLAGNVDAHHRVGIADLILVQRAVKPTLRRLMREWDPAVVGLSIMTFQRKTAFAIMAFLRALKPGVRIVVGGYDPSLARDVYEGSEADFIVSGEGEITLRELLRAIEQGAGYAGIPGLSYREDGVFRHNRKRGIADLSDIRPPNRGARVLSGYTMIGRQADVVETSRGCTFDCSFCSIIEMRGRNFHRFAIEYVIRDIADARARGARAIFLVDDNIVLDVKRFRALCEAIIAAGLDGIDYTVQAMTSTMADHGETLAPLMRKAGFRYVFLGIENVLEQDLGFLNAASKNLKRVDGKRSGNAALDAIGHIRRNGMFVVGGLIVGNPDDRREDIEANLEFARRSIDWPYIQHPTPYPGTPMSADLRARGLIAEDDVAQYDGTTAVVECAQVGRREAEFLRWRAERWMKVRHMPAMIRHDPLFSLLHGPALLAHTFRGSSVWSVLGLEDERAAFARYCEIRGAERDYMGEPVEPPPREMRARQRVEAEAA